MARQTTVSEIDGTSLTSMSTATTIGAVNPRGSQPGDERSEPVKEGSSPSGGDPSATERAVTAARALLLSLIEMSSLSHREIEKRLLQEGCGTDLGRLLGGRLDLKLRHILDICRVIDLYPAEFFRILFKEASRRSPLLARLDALTGRGEAPQAVVGQEARPSVAPEVVEMNRRLGEILYRLDALTSELGLGARR